jgi:TPR repeat protein
MSPFSSTPLAQKKSAQVKSPQLPGSTYGTSSGTSGSGQAPEQISADNLRRAKKISATPEQLWASVQAGSASAAVTLADLYMRGDGVPQNCDQARMLLVVASAKKNPQAIQKLHDLDKTGCPAPEAPR